MLNQRFKRSAIPEPRMARYISDIGFVFSHGFRTQICITFRV